MTTIINNPGENNNQDTSNASGGSGVIIGAVIVVLILIGVIVMALPYVRGRVDSMTKPVNPTINVSIPVPTQPSGSTTQ